MTMNNIFKYIEEIIEFSSFHYGRLIKSRANNALSPYRRHPVRLWYSREKILSYMV